MRHGMRCCRSKSSRWKRQRHVALWLSWLKRVPEATAADKKVAGVNSIYPPVAPVSAATPGNTPDGGAGALPGLLTRSPG
jgi:hypothetical protein